MSPDEYRETLARLSSRWAWPELSWWPGPIEGVGATAALVQVRESPHRDTTPHLVYVSRTLTTTRESRGSVFSYLRRLGLDFAVSLQTGDHSRWFWPLPIIVVREETREDVSLSPRWASVAYRHARAGGVENLATELYRLTEDARGEIPHVYDLGGWPSVETYLDALLGPRSP